MFRYGSLLKLDAGRWLKKKKTRIGQKWNNIGSPVSFKSRRHRLTIYFPDTIITLVSMSDKKSEDWQSQQCSSSTDGSALISWDKKTACQTDTAIYWTDCLIRIEPEHLKKERKKERQRKRKGRGRRHSMCCWESGTENTWSLCGHFREAAAWK